MRNLTLPALLLLVPACGDKDTTDDTSETAARVEGADQTIHVFDSEHVYFGDENLRVIDVEVAFPEADETYSSITGRFDLDCPNELCDHWDRYGTFGVVLDAGTDDEQYIEIDRFITAYRTGFDWEADLTAYRPLLTGTVTMRVYIDTWVGPGHDQGEGWLFDAELDFEGGPPPSPEPVAVVPVWGHLSWKSGLDDNPVEDQVAPGSVDLPAHTSATFRSFITGHGFGGSDNCAEFCALEHFYSVAGEEFGREVWREGCDETETDSRQKGTWKYDRAGWCPGAQVYPWDTDVTDAIGGAETAEVSYRLQDWTWDGSGGEPYYYMSGVLLLSE